TSLQFQRNEYLTGTGSSSVYGSTPRAAASVAPQMLFGKPIYASLNTEFAHIPNKQIIDGEVLTDRSLNRWDLSPMVRMPLSKLTFLSANASASYRTTHYSRSTNRLGILTDTPITRQFLQLRSEFIGPVLTKIWDTPTRVAVERMKHVIEPTVVVDYTSEFANQAQVPLVNDASDVIVGGAARIGYGITNRLFYRSRAAEGGRSQTREFLTLSVLQTYYTDSQSSLYDTTYVSYSRRPGAVDLSPVALVARFSPSIGFDANARAEYDVSGNGLQILSFGSTMSSEAFSSNFSYSRQRPSPSSDVNSILSGSSNVRFKEGRLTGLYALSWDIARGYVQSQTLGWSYMAQCCGVQADYQIFNYAPGSTAPVSADRRFNVSVVLAGLGSISSFFGAFSGLQ
ncbi:MAG TPA: hypothetical protein VIY56_02320, partial [Vicinamibacterales bacterium]